MWCIHLSPFYASSAVHLSDVSNAFSNLRAETLAQLMAHGGAHAGAKVLVFESCVGLVLGAAAYRMGGEFSLRPTALLID